MPAESTRLLIARHGETIDNAAGRWQGWSDSPLSPLGLAQAAALARRLAAE
ncbi:MAG: phosphoglycerate mutase family protein, partial [Chloroflexota bacterium]